MLITFYQFVLHLALPFFFLIQCLNFLLGRITLIQIKHQFGFVTPKNKFSMWMNAVSSGEVILAHQLMQDMHHRNAIITVGNRFAWELAKKKFDLSKHEVFYTPIDLFWIIHRWTNRMRPSVYLTVEHDLWPMTLNILEQSKCMRYLLNTSIKERDLRTYQKWPWLTPFLFRFNTIFCQNQQTRLYLKKLNISDEPEITGNLKISQSPPVNEIRYQTNKTIITLASFHDPEEKIVIENSKQENDVLWVLLPRHIERCEKLVQGFSRHNPVLWTKTDRKITPDQTMIIVNTMGEARSFMALSDIVLIGDSFKKSQGGHNILEPMELGKPTLYGDHYKSFPELTPFFESEGITHRLAIEDIHSTLQALINDPEKRNEIAKKSKRAFESLKPDREKVINAVNRSL